MASIKKIRAQEIIDSRGIPTIEAKLILDDGRQVITSIPSGASVGKSEAVELRDNDALRFDGQGVTKAVEFINKLIAPKLIGVSPLKQFQIDQWLIKADGTKNKSKLGANTILTISQLVAKAAAEELHVPLFKYINTLYQSVAGGKPLPIERLPSPMFNMINGGRHANNNLEFQEFHLIPSSSSTFAKAYEKGVEFFHELKRVLADKNAFIAIGDEGGFTTNFTANIDALEVINETILKKNFKPGLDVFLGLDIAASQFYRHNRYVIRDKPHPLHVDDYIEYIVSLTKNYSILILEDPLDEDDWQGWAKLNKMVSRTMYLVGDDLLTTNKERLTRAIKENVCNSILIKPNQVGTLLETLEVIDLARKNNMSCIVSHRSGETNDTFIADFAVGIQADFVKFGAPDRGERVAKYNRLLEIENEELEKPLPAKPKNQIGA